MKKHFLLFLSVMTSVSYAQAPVVDAFTPSSENQGAMISEQQMVESEAHSSQDLNAAIPKEQSILLSKLDLLEQEIQKLRGDLEVQQHNMKQLQEQQKAMFSDIDHRLAKLVPGESSVLTTSTTPSDTTGATTNQSNETQPSDANEKSKLEEQLVYQAAYKAIKARNFTQASADLKIFLENYPSGEYAPNAHYWLGEISLLQGNNDAASKEFTTLVKKYPKHPKAADAWFKLGYVNYNNGQWILAREDWKKVIKLFPNSTSAQLANNQLRKLDREGH